MAAAHAYCDALEDEAAAELQAARLLRAAVKIGAIVARPVGPSGSDPAWSETGDRYLVRLFRDFLFHQVRGGGNMVERRTIER